MNKIAQKKESNSKLLQILAKRDRNQFISTKEGAWPGQRRPSFAATIKVKHNSQPSHRPQLTERNLDAPLFSNNRLEMSRRNAKSLCSINTLSLRLKAESNGPMDYATKGKNSLKSYSSSKKMKSSESEIRAMGIDNEDYVIDYMAFNFIGKVIDTPELWAKFVHKKLAL